MGRWGGGRGSNEKNPLKKRSTIIGDHCKTSVLGNKGNKCVIK